jgi:catechol 2,3-dioxygenase-like lactoylglutathione lyase family enzyme
MSAVTEDQARSRRSREAAIPVKLAHFVLRTPRFEAQKAWYKTLLCAEVAFENDVLCFLAYDDEHHRVALLNMPELAAQSPDAAGVHHIAFTYASLTDLMNNYERLRDLGIKAAFPINHGPTTSLYYVDPDGNNIELQVDNFDTLREAGAFFYSTAFADNPIGVEFDPEELLRRLRAGEPEAELKKRPDVGKRGLADVKLR